MGVIFTKTNVSVCQFLVASSSTMLCKDLVNSYKLFLLKTSFRGKTTVVCLTHKLITSLLS